MFYIFISIISIFSSNVVKNKTYTLNDLIKLSYKKSPYIKDISAQKQVLDDAKSLVKSYYYPTFNFSQSFLNSNNPVNVFAFKLNQASFTQSDFSLNSLNKPDSYNQHLSSFTVKLPIYTAGQVYYEKLKLINNLNSISKQKSWTKKVLRENIYTLYYSLVYLEKLRTFLNSEKSYLDKLLSFYDAKTSTNKNRYLSFNKGRLIRESIVNAKDEVENNIKTVKLNISYLTTIDILDLVNINTSSKDILLDSKINTENLVREDLSAYKYRVKASVASETKNKRKYLPTLGAFANYNINSEDFSSSSDDYTLGLVLSWDIGLNSFRKVNLARSKSTLERTKYENYKAKVLKEIKENKIALENLRSKINKLEKMDKIYLENKNILTSQYRKGSMNLYNLLDNFAYYIENKANLYKAKISEKTKFIKHLNNHKSL